MTKKCFAKEHKCICDEEDMKIPSNREVMKYEFTTNIKAGTRIGDIKVFDRENNMYYPLISLLK